MLYKRQTKITNNECDEFLSLQTIILRYCLIYYFMFIILQKFIIVYRLMELYCQRLFLTSDKNDLLIRFFQ